MDPVFQKLIEFGIQAPSGENAQPWKFVVKEPGVIDVWVEEERDVSPYSWGHRSAYVAIGAAIENMRIGATTLGKELGIELFPNVASEVHVARLTIKDAPEIRVDPLAECIHYRSTNRKPYKKYSFTSDDFQTFKSAVPQGYAKLSLTNVREDLITLAKAGTTNERIMLNNKDMHDYFFSHVSWTPKEDQEKKVGFYVKTLELPPPAVMGFKLMSSWPWAQFLNTYLHFNEMVQKQNAKIYADSSAMGVISADSESPKNAVYAGMSMERIWLIATSHGFALQPIAGLIYLKLGTDNRHTDSFNSTELGLIDWAYETISDTFTLSGKPIYFMFRLGKADSPSARAVRFDISAVVQKE